MTPDLGPSQCFIPQTAGAGGRKARLKSRTVAAKSKLKIGSLPANHIWLFAQAIRPAWMQDSSTPKGAPESSSIWEEMSSLDVFLTLVLLACTSMASIFITVAARQQAFASETADWRGAHKAEKASIWSYCSKKVMAVLISWPCKSHWAKQAPMKRDG